jgi:hypothetical protein
MSASVMSEWKKSSPAKACLGDLHSSGCEGVFSSYGDVAAVHPGIASSPPAAGRIRIDLAGRAPDRT